ncbi:hypothetical protein [Pantoea ananatis]|uniref:hypothetical protein n=1 Tax=Pantoea ananas TaxID=553 RepID=UPI001B31227E|nr:hypothetical protein [Pantoea ananatis]
MKDTKFSDSFLNEFVNWLRFQINDCEILCEEKTFRPDADDEKALICAKIALAVLTARPEYQTSKTPGVWADVDREEALRNEAHGFSSRFVYTAPLTKQTEVSYFTHILTIVGEQDFLH